MFPVVLAASALAVVGMACVAVGRAVRRARRWCPGCHRGRLRLTSYLLCNPPPNLAYYACDDCGGEFVQAVRYDGEDAPLTPRAGPARRTPTGPESSPGQAAGEAQGQGSVAPDAPDPNT